MPSETRCERLAAELHAMRAIQQDSSILDFHWTGTPPDQYTLTFYGRSIRRRADSPGELEFVQRHEVEIRLPARYPAQPPDIRWLTPILHPNISFSGLVSLSDIGLGWDPDLGLDLICERLWDVARYQFINSTRIHNPAAFELVVRPRHIRLPTDARPLRGVSPERCPPRVANPLAFADAPMDAAIRFTSPLRHHLPRRRLYYIGPT